MRTVFFARLSAAGAFKASVPPTPNPFNPQSNTCTPSKTGPGSYRLTFGQGMRVSEYAFTVNSENTFAFGGVISTYLVSANGTVIDVGFVNTAAVSQDTDWWIEIEEIGSLCLS